jgi:hypothetical protein
MFEEDLTDEEIISSISDIIVVDGDVEFAEELLNSITYSELSHESKVDYSMAEAMIEDMKNELRSASQTGFLKTDWLDDNVFTELQNELTFFSLN